MHVVKRSAHASLLVFEKLRYGGLSWVFKKIEIFEVNVNGQNHSLVLDFTDWAYQF